MSLVPGVTYRVNLLVPTPQGNAFLANRRATFIGARGPLVAFRLKDSVVVVDKASVDVMPT